MLFFLNLHGFFLASLMAVGQLIVNRRSVKNLLFFGLFFDFALFEFHYLILEAGLLQRHPVIHILNLPAIYLLGPVVYFFARFSLEKNFVFHKRYLWHFIPVAVSFLAGIVITLTMSGGSTAFLNGYFYNKLSMFVAGGGYVLFLVYVVFIERLIFSLRLWRSPLVLREPSVLATLYLFGMLLVALVCDTVAAVSNSREMMGITVLVLSVLITSLFLINFRYPQFYTTLHQAVERRRRSYLKGLDCGVIHRELIQLMEKEELFTEEDLSLHDVSEKLGITIHQLSEFLNEKEKKNFKEFINGYRVEKAKSLLSRIKDRSVLDIGFEVGFKSKSTFNAIFLKMTGTTPSEYKKKL